MMTAMRDKKYDSLELKKVHMQCARAIRVFSSKVDPVWFDDFINSIGDIWESVGNAQGIKTLQSDAGLLVEAFGYMLSPKEYKEFLGVSQYTNEDTHSKEEFRGALKISLGLNTELNEFLGTKSVALQKPKMKVTKVKKPREKSKKQKKHEADMKKIADSKIQKKQTLQEIVRKARENAAKG